MRSAEALDLCTPLGYLLGASGCLLPIFLSPAEQLCLDLGSICASGSLPTLGLLLGIIRLSKPPTTGAWM